MKPLQAALGVMAALAGFCSAQTVPAQKRLPYATVDRPQFVPAGQASFMGDTDRVIGLMDGKIAKVYAASILSQHGVVQDRLTSGPIAVTW